MHEGEEANSEENKKVNIKSIHFILKKSEELEKDHLLVSFLCTLYIAEQLNNYLKNNYGDTEAKNIMIKCIDKAEQIRPLFDSVDYNKLADFCKKLFLAADKCDRNEEMTKRTMHMFFTSQIFYEILNHFRQLDDDEKEKYMYAKYKTIYLKKCFDKDIKPESGLPVEQKGETSLSAESDEEIRKEGKEMNEKSAHNETINEKIIIKNDNHNNYFEDIKELELDKRKKVEKNVDFALSLRHAQYAVNAIMFEDLTTAKRELQLALSYLE
ncbi:vacuolar protein sorting-associated protein VTA1, putative [Plasmodium malariae]|uniref:Vacuolar protein sorting-associated protein VTA1, putative n=1 Tax=Plasmodium malariae TaxID=5858 RepID=A0A1C3K9Q7_PLAMA|nr:vacuolar protein sorting-associated protein VTA1, putative [Plasmodium malariae]